MKDAPRPAAAPRFLAVLPEDDGQRLDRWLKKHVPDLPYVLAQKLVRKGAIRVDDKKTSADARLAAGSQIRLPIYEPGNASLALFRDAPGDEAFIRSLVLYDDGDIVVLNKPHGIAVQGGSKIQRHIDGLLDHLKDKNGMRPRLIHRLDRDTSGVLVVARELKTAGALGKLLANRDVRKEYWALTAPAPERDEGRIDAPLGKGSGNMKDMVLIDLENGKSAVTEYRVVERAMQTAAFVAFWPRSGRTHQIRVHAVHLGAPILGDGKYGEKDHPGFEGMNLARRLHLHARRITFRNPSGKGNIDVRAPLPDDLRRSWQALGFDPDTKIDPFQNVKL